MGNLLPGEPIIYEKSGGTLYARYRDRPNIPRWVVAEYDVRKCTLEDIEKAAQDCPTLKKQLDQLLTTYYLIKDDKNK